MISHQLRVALAGGLIALSVVLFVLLVSLIVIGTQNLIDYYRRKRP